MQVIAFILLATCLVGASLADRESCPEMIKAYQACKTKNEDKEKEALQERINALKVKVKACYVDNGCASPTRLEKNFNEEDNMSDGEGGNAQKCKQAAREAKRQMFRECVKDAHPGYTFRKNADHYFGHHSHGVDKMVETKDLADCTKKEQVRECKRNVLNNAKPTEVERKARFYAKCDAKQVCKSPLGAECRDQLRKIRKTKCDCHTKVQEQAAEIRSSVKACEGVPKKKHQYHKKHPACDRNYCHLGFEAFLAHLEIEASLAAKDQLVYLQAKANVQAKVDPLVNVKAKLEPLVDRKDKLEPVANLKAKVQSAAGLEPVANLKARVEPLAADLKAKVAPMADLNKAESVIPNRKTETVLGLVKKNQAEPLKRKAKPLLNLL